MLNFSLFKLSGLMSILQAKWVVEQTNQQEETITQIQNVEHSTGNWSELWKKTNIVEKSVCACVRVLICVYSI